MDTDPYYWTQDNGAGGPVHFATTYKQIDMLHHILRNCPVAVNQRDSRGFTPLHRAAYLSQYDGYLELYEYLLSEGADPSLLSDDYDPYLNPGRKTPLEFAVKDGPTRDGLRALEEKYAHVQKRPKPHRDIGDWWALYDYGPQTVYEWSADHKPDYPEVRRNHMTANDKRESKLRRRDAREAAVAEEVARRERTSVEQMSGFKIISSGDDATSGTTVAAGAVAGVVAAETPPTSSTPPAASDVAFLFPGQGSQSVGMMGSIARIPAVAEMCKKAEEILGYDLLHICVNGPKDKLDDTVYAQPALFLAGLAAVEKLRAENPEVVNRCARVAGLSLGEYTALVFAGAMSFEDGLKVVKIRAEAMKEAASVGEHGMLSVIGLGDETLSTIVKRARETVTANRRAKDGNSASVVVCSVANYLFPTGRVVSGDSDALEEVERLALEKNAMKTARLAVSGAFHTERMAGAREQLERALAEITITAPKIPCYSNVTGGLFASVDPSAIRTALAEQLVSPVRWEDTLRNMLEEQSTITMYELGPNKQIKSMSKRVSNEAWKKFQNVDVA